MKKIICLIILLSLVGCSLTNHKSFGIPSILGDSKGYKTENDICTYADALVYGRENLKEQGKSILIDRVMKLVKDDYDEIMRIEVKYNDGSWDYLIYIKTNNKFVLLDPYEQINNKSNIGDEYVFDTYEDLENSIKTLKKNKTISKTKLDYGYVKNNGIVYTVKYDYGIPLLVFDKYDIPLALGFPTINSEQMQELIKFENNDKVQDAIKTIADAINYLLAKNYQIDNNEDGTHFLNNIDFADAGNIHYSDEWAIYTASGLELLSIEELQCSSSSTLFKYLVEGDYSETGYTIITMLFEGHAEMYVKGNDDKYYIINPAGYLNKKESYYGWFKTNGKAYGTTIQDAANGLYEFIENDWYMQVKSMFSFSYDGVLCWGTLTVPSNNDALKKHYFPEGSNPICNYGNVPVDTFVPKHNTSQDNIINLKGLKYFENEIN